LNTLWNKIWADLRSYKARTFLAVCSIAAGVFCVGTLFGMIDLQLAKMDAAHRLSLPSHINMILRNDADAALGEQIKAVPGVAQIDTMTPLTIRFKLPGQAEWDISTLILRTAPTKQLFDKTTLQSGSWPAGESIAIENLSAQFTGLQLGNQIEIETPTGIKSLNISGIVRHPFVKPPSFGGQIHFFADSTATYFFGQQTGTFRQLLLQIKPPYSEESARSIAQDIRILLSHQNIGVNVTLLQNPEKHWGRPFFAGINRILQIMAMVSLALASVLILNTVAAQITQQTDQIGIMKALGAKTSIIARLYLSEAFLTSLAAIILAVPFSLYAANLSSCKLLALFNIDCGAFDFSPSAITAMLIGGLFAPLLAALGPVFRGATLPVREAIVSYGLGNDFGNTRLDFWIEQFGARFLPTLYAAALGNLFRRKGRLLLTQSVLIIAGALFLILMSLIASVNLTLDNELARSRYAVRLGFSGDQSAQTVIDLAKSLAQTRSVETWQRLPMNMAQHGTTLRQKGSLGAQLIALPSNTTMYQPLIEKGRWFQSSDKGQRFVVISADSADLNKLEVGDKVDIRLGKTASDWQIIGTYRWLAGSNYVVEPVYAPLETVEDLTLSRQIASFALLEAPLETLEQEAGFVRKLQETFHASGIKLDVYTTIAKLEQRQFARNQFKPVITTLLGLAAMIGAVGGIGLSGALAIGVLQRIREIGVLRAIGAPSKSIFRLFQLEGLLHGFIAWLVTVPLAYFAAHPISDQLGKTMLGIQLDYRFDVSAVFYWLGIVSVIAWIASYWPARKASRLTVLESLGH
jgi:putative ABC transport system permease protein